MSHINNIQSMLFHNRLWKEIKIKKKFRNVTKKAKINKKHGRAAVVVDPLEHRTTSF